MSRPSATKADQQQQQNASNSQLYDSSQGISTQQQQMPSMMQQDTKDASDVDRIVEESPNRRYAKVWMRQNKTNHVRYECDTP